MTSHNSVRIRNLISPTTREIKPITNCIRCGAPEQSQKGRMANRRIPNWFHGENVTPNVQGLSTSQARKIIREMADTELNRLQKVQEWLRLSYKYPHVTPKATVGNQELRQMASQGIHLPPIGMVRDYTMTRDFRYTPNSTTPEPSAFPSVVSNELSYLEFRRNKHGKFGLNAEFSDYLTPNKTLKLRDDVGPIQRPHTPLRHLETRQKALYGKQMFYEYLESNRQTTGQKIDSHRKKIHNLKLELKDMIGR